MRVLVVEDEAMIAMYLEDELESAGCFTKLARDSTEAFMAVSAERFDLAVVDLGLPGESGVDLIHRMHQMAPTMRFIVCTGYDLDDALTGSVPAGVRFLQKPCSGEALVEMVRAVLAGGKIGRGPR